MVRIHDTVLGTFLQVHSLAVTGCQSTRSTYSMHGPCKFSVSQLRCTNNTYHIRNQILHCPRTDQLHAHDDFSFQNSDELQHASSAVCLYRIESRTTILHVKMYELTLCAYRKGRPIPTAVAPKHNAFNTSVPRLTPPSRYTEQKRDVSVKLVEELW